MSPSAKSHARGIKTRLRWGNLVLAPPGPDDLILLLKAWRFWLLGGLLGALLGAGVFGVAPPPYRARATVNVDFHLEQAWPQNSDREQFYYLERETRKLVEIAMSDATLRVVADADPGMTIAQLRGDVLQLSQPGNGGWHFYADDPDPARAALLAATWARSFAGEVKRSVLAKSAGGLEPYLTADLMQVDSGLISRTQSLGTYMLLSACIALGLGALGVLVLRSRR